MDIPNALCKAKVAYAFRVADDKSAVGLPESREQRHVVANVKLFGLISR